MFPFLEFFKEPKPATPPVRPVLSVPEILPKPSGILRVSEHFHLDTAAYTSTGERDAILASSGMGKSYLTGVLIEETLESGGLVCVIDPEGEHWTLAERYPVMVVGGEHASLPLEESRIDGQIEAMLTQGVSAVFDLSDYIDSDQQAWYALIAGALFQAETEYKRKIRLIVEEAQIYAPQTGMPKPKDGEENSLSVSQNVAKRGRKRALDSLWATQRPASISKDILSQCNRFWFGGIQADQDYKAIKTYLDQAGISLEQVRSLERGEFYCFTQGTTTRLKVRKRFCKHGGATPMAAVNRPVASKKDLKGILDKLR